MARLPVIINERGIPAVGGDVASEQAIDNTGAALAKLGAAGTQLSAQVYATEKAARDQNAARGAVAQITQKLDQYRIELDKDPDYARREEKFNTEARRLRGELIRPLSAQAQTAFDERVTALYASQAHAVRTQARKDELDGMRVDLDRDVDTLLDSAVNVRNKVERAAKIDEIRTAIETARDTGVFSPAQAKTFHKQTLGKLDELTVSRVMRTNPGAALALLDDRQATPSLDPLRREQLKIAATNQARTMSALAKAETTSKVHDTIRAFEEGNFQPAGLDDTRAAAAKFPELSRTLNRAEYVYRSAADFAAKDIKDQIPLIASMRDSEKLGVSTPTDTTLRAAYEKIADNEVRRFHADPVAAAIRKSPVVGDAIAAAQRANDPSALQAANAELIETQRRNLVPEHRIALLTKDNAEKIEATLTAPPSQAVVDTIDGLKASYGDEGFKRVFAQLNQGKKLPGYVKMIAAIEPARATEADKSVILRAMTIPEKEWESLIPDASQRKQFKAEAASKLANFAQTMVKDPSRIGSYADVEASVEAVAKYIYSSKAASSIGAATVKAREIVIDNHWATADTVRIPKVSGVPVIEPRMVEDYAQFWREKRLDGWHLQMPERTPGARGVTDEEMMRQRRDFLRKQGYWVADGPETGMVLLDGNGWPARDIHDQPVRVDWDMIRGDEEFQAWRRGVRDNRSGAPPTRPAAPVSPGLLPDRDPYKGRDQDGNPLPKKPGDRSDAGSRDGVQLASAGLDDVPAGPEPAKGDPAPLPFDNPDDWARYYKAEIVPDMPFADKYKHRLAVHPSGDRMVQMDFPNTEEGRRDLRKWTDHMMEAYPDGTPYGLNYGSHHVQQFIFQRRPGM